MPTATKAKRAAKKVKAPTVTVTLADFDTSEPFRVYRDGMPIEEFTPLTLADFVPRGGTPLRDATATFVAHLEAQRAPDRVVIGCLLDRSGSMGGNEQSVVSGVNEFVGGMAAVEQVDADAAGTVLAVIVTDGEENSSTEVSAKTLSAMISEREGNGFTFIFLGANQDAWAEGHSMGIVGGVHTHAVNYASTPAGTKSAMGEVSNRGVGYLSDNAQFLSSHAQAGTTRSSVTEDGELTTDNLGTPAAPAPSAPHSQGGWASPANSAYDVEDALKKARESTSKKEE